MGSDPSKHIEGGHDASRAQSRERLFALEITDRSGPLTGVVLGPYEVGERIGSGGMGEVYRARDLSLSRDVALKVLPPLFARDAARLARFKREAQLLASLNHPNIAAIYGFEETNDVHALVLELVEGPTLAERIARGPIPSRDAMPIARQIALALEAAHQQGIVHRDLKPANVKVRADGTVKVLDFGLAKALDPAVSIDGETTVPATTSPALTAIGVLLGTAAYMSPEQARGYPADKRSDVWAFGAVLYEMLTGRRAFAGEGVSDTLAAVLRDEPDWTALPADVAPAIRTLIEGCLQKDRRSCVSDIATVRFLTDNQHAIGLSPKSTTPGKRRNRIALTTMVALTAAAITGVVAWTVKPPATLTGRVTRFVIPLAEDRQLTNRGRQVTAISPDGTTIVYVANQRLYVRLMSEVDARPLGGTEGLGGVTTPVFAPDGQSVAFWSNADRTLKRIALGGGRALTICQAQNPLGMSWDRNSLIFGQREGIMQVSADGGDPRPLVTNKSGEFAYGPQILPGDRGTLFTLVSGSTVVSGHWDEARIVVQTSKDREPKVLIDGGSDARYFPTGHIVYALGGRLFAVPFDLTRLEVRGGPVPLLEGIARANASPAAQFSVSEGGSLVYLPGPVNPTSEPPLRLAWLDRTGKTDILKLRPGLYESPRISPDGQRVAFGALDNSGENIWIYDLSETTDARRLTFAGRNRFPVWSPDGRYVAFRSDREGDAAIFQQLADASDSTAKRLTTPEKGTLHVPESWRPPEGDVLSFSAQTGNHFSLRLFSVRDRKETAVPGVASEVPPLSVFSPDGRWLAYNSGTFAKRTVFAQRFPPTGNPNQISVGPIGYRPMWSRDGKELFYVNAIGPPDQGAASAWVAVKVTTDPIFKVSSPEPVPNGGLVIGRPSQGENLRNYDMGPDGRRLGLVVADGSSDLPGAAEQIQVVLNWFEELKQRVPTR